MRTFHKLIAAGAIAATATAMAVVPAMANPPKGVTPRAKDIVGFGSDTIQNLFDQFSINYNATVKKSAPHLYSFDATGPGGVLHDSIKAKTGCAKAPRPNGSSEGILGTAGGPYGLTANTKDPAGGTGFCSDFARSSRARATGDPANIDFVPFALDAVTFATNAGSNAPSDLTTAQLAEIYTCTVPATAGHPKNNWADLGGKPGKINAQLPQTGSGTRKFFLTALGAGVPITPGACVDSTKGESPNNLPEENEGTNKFLQGPNTVYPYSVADWIAQVFHSARANKTGTCTPGKGQNLFGCDIHGSMQLRDINRTAPLQFLSSQPTLDSRSFSPAFIRQVFIVVRGSKVPGYLSGLFGPHGWLFTSKTAKNDILSYGFLPFR
ncbi:MAG TPA: substrate-binding domain-containing protein [Streptosporangiaceae bacterium]|nr:substrate-binding domain-containing protein [Streptosporangiaceae bacterium]